MPELALKARGVTIDIPSEVVEKLRREQGLTNAEIVNRFARAVDRILDAGANASSEYFMM